MKKIFLIAVLLLIPRLAQAQVSITNTTCPGIGCTDINVAGQGSIGIQITGTWVGTITFKSTIDNSTYTDLRVVSSADTTSTGVTTTTANGSFQTGIAGIAKVRIVFTSWMSGTALVSSRVTNQAGKFLGSGGALALNCPAAADTQVLYDDAGTCAGDSAFLWNKTSNELTVTGHSGFGTLGVPDTTTVINIREFNTTDQPAFSLINVDSHLTPTINGTAALTGIDIGLQGTTAFNAQDLTGIADFVDHDGTGTIATLNGILIAADNANTGTVTALKGIDITASKSGGGVVTTLIGLNVNDATGGGTNYAIKTGLGIVKFGDVIQTGGSGLAVANVGVNSCGTTAATIAGNSNSFEITVGTVGGTQCRVTFPTAAPVRWNCVLTDSTTTIATRSTFVDTTHTDFLGAFVAGDVLTAICMPR